MKQDSILAKSRFAFGFMASMAALLIALGYLPRASAQEFNSRSIAAFTAAQADAGQRRLCQKLRLLPRAELGGSEFASALRGLMFSNNWGGKTAADLFTYINTKMPPACPARSTRKLPRRSSHSSASRTE